MLEKLVGFFSTALGIVTGAAMFSGVVFIKSAVKGWKQKSEALKAIRDAELARLAVLAEHTKSNDQSIAVQKIVCRLLGFTEADRVGVFRYHNGVKTFNGECLRYVTCTEEDCAFGIASVMEEYTGKRISPDIAFLLDKIDKSDGCYVINVSDLAGAERVLQDSYGLTKSYNFKLGDSVWEGVLSIVYLKEEYELDEEQIRKINACIKLINDLKK